MFVVGNDIIYWDKNKSQWPGKILNIDPVRPKIKIMINHETGDKKIWVKPKNLTPQ